MFCKYWCYNMFASGSLNETNKNFHRGAEHTWQAHRPPAEPTFISFILWTGDDKDSRTLSAGEFGIGCTRCLSQTIMNVVSSR